MIDFQVTRWFGDEFRAAHPDLIQAITRVFLANDLDCYAASCTLLGEADLRPFLPAFRMPVAVIVGEEDYATPVAMARQLHEAIQGSTLTILPLRVPRLDAAPFPRTSIDPFAFCSPIRTQILDVPMSQATRKLSGLDIQRTLEP